MIERDQNFHPRSEFGGVVAPSPALPPLLEVGVTPTT